MMLLLLYSIPVRCLTADGLTFGHCQCDLVDIRNCIRLRCHPLDSTDAEKG